MPAPAAGFNPISQSKGRINSVTLAVDATTDLMSASVVNAATTATQVNFTDWEKSDKLNGVELVTFESPATAQGVLRPRRLRGGVAPMTITLKGVYDGNSAASSTSDHKFPVGAFLKVDLLLHKGSGLGHYGTTLEVLEVTGGASVKATEPAPLNIVCALDGDLPTPIFV